MKKTKTRLLVDIDKNELKALSSFLNQPGCIVTRKKLFELFISNGIKNLKKSDFNQPNLF